MTEDFEKFEYGDGMSILISYFLYTKAEVGIRELLVNGWDQYLDEQVQEKPKELFLTLNPVVRAIDYHDNATGIVGPIADFKRIAPMTATGGKRVGNQESTPQKPHSAIVGQWHLGKASYVKMSERKVGEIVTFRSNNGREGWKGCFVRKENGELGWGKEYVYEGEDARLVKPEIGLAVQIVDVVPELLKIKHVKSVIQRDLGILIARGLKIYIRDINKSDKFSLIEAPADLNVKNEIHNTPELKMSDSGVSVSHCLKEKEKPDWNNIDIYVKHVWIKSIHVDFKVQGWINYNFGLNLARDGIEVNDIYKEALSYDPTDPTNDGKVIQYIRNNYDPWDSPKRKDKINNQKDIEEAFADMLEIMNELFSEEPVQLAGDESEKGQTGTVKKGSGKNSKKWEKIENVSIVDNAGDPNSDPIKVIGGGIGGGGGVYHGGEGAQGIQPGGKYTVLRKTGNQDDNNGNVKPSVQIVYGEPNEPKPMAFMPTDGVLFLNEQFNAVKTLLYDMPKNRVFDMLFPLMAQAGIEYQTRNRAELSISEFTAMVSRLLESMLAKKARKEKK